MSHRQRALLEVIEGWRPPPEDPMSLAKAIEWECGLVERLPPYPEAPASEWNASLDKFVSSVTRARDVLPQDAKSMLLQHLAMNDRRFQGWPPLDDMLDALLDAALDLRGDAPPEYARPRPEIAKIYGAARACVEHGVKVSASERSRFLSIVKVIIPERSDHRGLVRQAKEGVNFPKNP